MASPLSIFRKHEKKLIVFFGILLMVSFLVAGSLTQFLEQRNRASQDKGRQVAVTWKYGKLAEDDLYQRRRMHNLVMMFLQTLIRRTEELKGQPPLDTLLVPQLAASDAEIVRTMLLAKKAETMGLQVSDKAILDYLKRLSDNKIQSQAQFEAILEDASDQRMPYQQMLIQMRTELLAINMSIIATSGLTALPTPTEYWDYHNRLNRYVQVELLPLNVADYTSKIEGKPSDTVITQLYEEGKNRYPNAYLPEPGFKVRQKLAFQYLKANLDTFIEVEKAKLTEEQVRREYEARKAKGDFKVLKRPAGPQDEDLPGQFIPPANEDPADKDPAENAQVPMTNDQPADDAGEKIPATGEAAPADTEDGKKSGDGSQPETDESGLVTPPATESFVSFGDSEDTSDDDPAAADAQEKDEPTVTPTEPASESPTAEAPAAPDKPANDATPPTTPETKPADESTTGTAESNPPTATPPTATPPTATPPTATPPTTTPSTTTPPVSTPPVATTPAATTEVPEFKSFEQVEDEIRRSLVEDSAQKALDEALKQAAAEVRLYFVDYVKWETLHKADATVKEPAPLDAKAIAKKYKLTYGQTPLVDATEIDKYEIGKTSTIQFPTGQGQQIRFVSFAELAYGSDVKLYVSQRISGFSGASREEFLYWKTEEQKTFVPKLTDIRDKVVDAWKKQQAFELAKKDAAAKAAEVRASGKSLKEMFGDRVIKPNTFSWMSPGGSSNIGMGGGAPRLSSVAGVNLAGDEFMRPVFALQVGECGTAVDQAHDNVYVARVESELEPRGYREQRFLRSGPPSNDIMAISQGEIQQIYRDWIENLEKEFELKWQRDPSSRDDS